MHAPDDLFICGRNFREFVFDLLYPWSVPMNSELDAHDQIKHYSHTAHEYFMPISTSWYEAQVLSQQSRNFDVSELLWGRHLRWLNTIVSCYSFDRRVLWVGLEAFGCKRSSSYSKDVVNLYR